MFEGQSLVAASPKPKWTQIRLTLTGSAKLGNGGAPNVGRTEINVSTIAITGMKIARHSAIKSCLVNLNNNKRNSQI